MIKIFNKLLDIIFPKNMTCVICNKELNHNHDNEVCDECEKNLPKVGKTCERCGSEISSLASVCNFCMSHKKTYEKAIAPFKYENCISKIVWDLKFENKKFLAKTMAFYMAKHYEKFDLECDMIIPVPLHEKRLKQRGYNQSQLIAEHIGKYLNMHIENENLVKINQTTNQVGLGYRQRQENLKNAFKVLNRKNIKGKTILLVDDVFTTGATASCCSKVLLASGAKNVYVLCFAHTNVE